MSCSPTLAPISSLALVRSLHLLSVPTVLLAVLALALALVFCWLWIRIRLSGAGAGVFCLFFLVLVLVQVLAALPLHRLLPLLLQILRPPPLLLLEGAKSSASTYVQISLHSSLLSQCLHKLLFSHAWS